MKIYLDKIKLYRLMRENKIDSFAELERKLELKNHSVSKAICAKSIAYRISYKLIRFFGCRIDDLLSLED